MELTPIKDSSSSRDGGFNAVSSKLRLNRTISTTTVVNH